jgi:hypothetical protein
MAEAKKGGGGAKKATSTAPGLPKEASARAAEYEARAIALIEQARETRDFNRSALASQQATAFGLLACSARIEQAIASQQRLPINRGDDA